MSAYQRGNYHERKACDFLVQREYVCWQTRQSRGIADIIALHPILLPMLVQVKSTQGSEPRITHSEWNILFRFASRLRARPIVVRCYPSERDKRAYEMDWVEITGEHKQGSRTWPHMPMFLGE